MPHSVAEHLADLADGAAGAQRLAHRRKQVLLAARRSRTSASAVGRLAGVALRADARRALELPPLDLRVDAVQLDLLAARPPGSG